jgi:hypothetical protein
LLIWQETILENCLILFGELCQQPRRKRHDRKCDKEQELGHIGGKTKGTARVENADTLPSVDNAVAVRDTVARLIAEVYAGRLNPRVAAGLTPMMNLQLRSKLPIC